MEVVLIEKEDRQQKTDDREEGSRRTENREEKINGFLSS